MGKLDGRVAVITGGARGQGRTHALALAREGADVVVCDVAEQMSSVPYDLATRADLDETARLVEDLDRRCVAVEADVASGEQMRGVAERAMSEFGRIDVLLANAGICTPEQSWEMSDEHWQQTIDTNLTGAWQSCKAVIPHMISGERGGAIVITSSVAGLKGLQGLAHYAASKHGVVGLMRTLAIELAPYDIRVNTVHPTGVATGMLAGAEWVFERFPRMGAGSSNLLDVRVVQPEDVSAAVLWLVSDDARYVTGVTLPVDAGATTK